jgi:hypothetical protein
MILSGCEIILKYLALKSCNTSNGIVKNVDIIEKKLSNKMYIVSSIQSPKLIKNDIDSSTIFVIEGNVNDKIELIGICKNLIKTLKRASSDISSDCRSIITAISLQKKPRIAQKQISVGDNDTPKSEIASRVFVISYRSVKIPVPRVIKATISFVRATKISPNN